MTRVSRSICPGVIRRPSSRSLSSASRFFNSHSSALNTSLRGYSGADFFVPTRMASRTRSFSVGSMYLGSRVSSRNSRVDGGLMLAVIRRSLSSINVRGSRSPPPSTRCLSRSRSCGSRGILAFLWSAVYSASLSSMRVRSSSSAAAAFSSRYLSSSSICSTCVAVWVLMASILSWYSSTSGSAPSSPSAGGSPSGGGAPPPPSSPSPSPASGSGFGSS
mmetsp:Transcript_290/g.1348  ORF Transcript_290/g.1348 Transcript_290/m.1348 type:complete len:219 (+) Transcript_290:4701-5357(+)